MSNNDTRSRAEPPHHNRSAENQPHVQFPPMADGEGQRATRLSSHLEPIERTEIPSARRKTPSSAAARRKSHHLHSLLCSVLAHARDFGQAYGPANACRITEHARKICETLEAADDRFCSCRRHRPTHTHPRCPKCLRASPRSLHATLDQHAREAEAEGGEASADAPARSEPVNHLEGPS